MKTKLEIIEETVAVYSNPENRAVRHDRVGQMLGCDYFQETTGKMCALGRCLANPVEFAAFGGYADVLARDYGNGSLDPLLKEDYRGHEVQFWRDLQSLHDADEHFTANGYSQEGVEYIKGLKNTYADA